MKTWHIIAGIGVLGAIAYVATRQPELQGLGAVKISARSDADGVELPTGTVTGSFYKGTVLKPDMSSTGHFEFTPITMPLDSGPYVFTFFYKYGSPFAQQMQQIEVTVVYHQTSSVTLFFTPL